MADIRQLQVLSDDQVTYQGDGSIPEQLVTGTEYVTSRLAKLVG